MRAFKENPVFFSLTALLLLCSVTFSVLALLGVMKKSKTKTAFEEAQSRLERAVTRKPYPVQDNLDKSEENLAALEAARAEHESKLLAEGGLDLIPDGSPNYEQAVKERIKDGYIKSMRELATANRVKLKADEAFGFSDYSGAVSVTDNDLLGQALDKQRAILDYVVGELLSSTTKDSSDITDLVSVQREQVESAVAPTLSVSSEDVFDLDPKMSARVEGAIDTHAFRIEFIGYTSGLRNFFNKLAEFKRPVVVRDVKVDRKQADPLAAAAPPPPSSPSPFGAPPFGTPGVGAAAPGAPSEELVQKPVVDKNLSRFVIILEYIELAKTPEAVEEEG